MQTKANTFDVR